MDEILNRIEKISLVPVVVLEDAKQAAPLAGALCKGGLPCAEVTFRTDAAEESIRRMSREYPDMLIGAGTVLTTEQADRAVGAGAKFIVSPGFNPRVVGHCIERGITILPGTANPSDVEQAIEMGLEVVKFFPAEAAGGLEMIKSMAAPYTRLRFMPTGGIDASNLGSYLAYPKILACGGSWMVKPELVRAGQFEEITRLTREAVLSMLELKILQIRVPEKGEPFPILDQLLAFGGTQGEILIGTPHLERAKNYLETQGMEFDEKSVEYQDGRMLSVDLKKGREGYRICLKQSEKCK